MILILIDGAYRWWIVGTYQTIRYFKISQDFMTQLYHNCSLKSSQDDHEVQRLLIQLPSHSKPWQLSAPNSSWSSTKLDARFKESNLVFLIRGVCLNP